MTMGNETEKRNEMTDAKLIQALMSDIGVTYVSQEQFEQDNLPSGVHGAPAGIGITNPGAAAAMNIGLEDTTTRRTLAVAQKAD